MISCHAKFPEYQDKKILSKCQLKETIIWWRGLGWRAQNIKKQKKNRTTGVQNRPTLEMVPSGEVRPKQDGEAHTSGSSGAGSDGRAQTTGSGRMRPDGTETFGRSGPDDAETSGAKGPDGAETSGWQGADWHCTGHITGSEPHARTLQTPCQSAVWVRGTWRQETSRCRRLGRLGWVCIKDGYRCPPVLT